ncbi:MAG: hypothetical protein AAB310_01070 [Nitrospirota bacterium]|jgi:hypothetical protein|nr:hypothetical protein [Thermodesulfovibrionia bacterium]
MLDKIKKNLNEGVKQVKWFAAFLSERTRVETSMAKLLFESSKLESKLDSFYCDIGKRVLELEGKGEKAILKDFMVVQAIGEVKKLKEQIEDYKSRAHALGKVSE